jgi:hypothetical protein
MQIACNVDGTVHWQATVTNSGACQTVGAYAAPLLVRLSNGRLLIVQIQAGTMTFQPGTNVVQGDFCYPFAPNTQSVQAYFTLLTNSCFDLVNSNSIAPCPVTPACPLIFTDVPPSHKFYSEITSLTAMKLISGYEDGTFRPEASMTRGTAVKILVQAFDIPLQTSKVMRFNDVQPDTPYFAYVNAAYARGLVSGYADGTFRPEQAITRGALVKMVVRAAGWEFVKPKKPTFADVSAESPSYPYVETAAAHGVLADLAPGGTLQVNKEVSRGEGAAIVAGGLPPPTSNLPTSLEALLKQLLEGSTR